MMDRLIVAWWRLQEAWQWRHETIAGHWWRACVWLVCLCPCGSKNHRLLIEALLKSCFINEPTYLRVCDRLDYWPDKRILSHHFMAHANAIRERLEGKE